MVVKNLLVRTITCSAKDTTSLSRTFYPKITPFLPLSHL